MMQLNYLTGIACLFICGAVGANGAVCKQRNLVANVDDVMRLYIDGIEITGLPNANDYLTADIVDLPCTARVIGMEGLNHLTKSGIVASTDDGYVLTNSSWKCTNTSFAGWQTIGFDDSDWPSAQRASQQREDISGIRNDSEWIWTAESLFEDPLADQWVYCRKTLDINECLLGPPENECDPLMGKCINLFGNYSCSCYKGYVNSGSTRCEAATCQKIKNAQPDAPSGKYFSSSKSGILFEIYCEMGLNDGGYTFLSPDALSVLTNEEISSAFTNRSSFLLRALTTNGSQPYGVLSQLSEYEYIPLMLGLSNQTGYKPPANNETIGKPYLYFGFLPIDVASNNNIQGLEVNGNRITFTNCDSNPNSQMTLFPNFREVEPSTKSLTGLVCDDIFSNLKLNPSGRLMPPEFFVFGEMYWGGCGCFIQTNQIPGILGLIIGFK